MCFINVRAVDDWKMGYFLLRDCCQEVRKNIADDQAKLGSGEISSFIMLSFIKMC